MGSLISVAARPPAFHLTNWCTLTKARRSLPPVVTIVGGEMPLQRLVRVLLSELDVVLSVADGLDEALAESDLVLYCCGRLEPEHFAATTRGGWRPVVVLTTDDRADQQARVLAAGAEAVVLMPFDPSQVLRLTAHLLQQPL